MASRRSERVLEESRRRFEARLAVVRHGVDREVGVAAPDAASLTVPLLAFAGGFAAAAALVGRFRRRSRALEQRRSASG